MPTISYNDRMIPPFDLENDALPDGWVKYYRSDEWSSTADNYPETRDKNLPLLADVARRTYKMMGTE